MSKQPEPTLKEPVTLQDIILALENTEALVGTYIDQISEPLIDAKPDRLVEYSFSLAGMKNDFEDALIE